MNIENFPNPKLNLPRELRDSKDNNDILCFEAVDQYLNLQDFGFNGYILHTPGHSPGSQSIIVDNEIALVGDAMFGVFPGSIFPPFADNEEELITSWGKLIQTGCRLFLPSHGTADKSDLLKIEYQKRTPRISHD